MERREFLKYGGATLVCTAAPSVFFVRDANGTWISMLSIVSQIVATWGGAAISAWAAEQRERKQFENIKFLLKEAGFTKGTGHFHVDGLPGISAHKPHKAQTQCFGVGTDSGSPAMLEAGGLICLYDFIAKYRGRFSEDYLKSVSRPLEPGIMQLGDVLEGYNRPSQYGTRHGDNTLNWETWNDGQLTRARGEYQIVDSTNRRKFKEVTKVFMFDA